ncbi:hypothetical protein [Parasitella parasitica]|uniref:Uncharacterized protein n=1 Tax=Parasitella parasitica TaxID=35722 RepID=A0A0B7NF03_9FUNG|nr:hypothetical protein [Parasitella parasitica]
MVFERCTCKTLTSQAMFLSMEAFAAASIKVMPKKRVQFEDPVTHTHTTSIIDTRDRSTFKEPSTEYEFTVSASLSERAYRSCSSTEVVWTERGYPSIARFPDGVRYCRTRFRTYTDKIECTLKRTITSDRVGPGIVFSKSTEMDAIFPEQFGVDDIH